MIWVCRAGNSGSNYYDFINEKRIFLAWDGYRFDLRNYNNMEEAKIMVAEENPEASKTAISTWASQILNFVYEMQIGDYVIVPSPHSRDYCAARIIGEYSFDNRKSVYCHGREIQIIKEGIRREEFPGHIINSLGAYRNVFKVGHQEEVIGIFIKNGWIKEDDLIWKNDMNV